MIKSKFFSAALVIAMAGLSFTLPTTENPACGVFSVGKYKVDLKESTASTTIPKDALIANVKSGLSFTGSKECPGTFTLVDASVTVYGSGPAPAEYNYAIVKEMSTMESYMLERYFNGAVKITFHSVKAKNSAGETIELPSVTYVVK
jgi:hypothetical protein